MKRRQAFVANSSSSSFMIAYTDIEKASYYVKVPDFVKSLVDNMIKLFLSGQKIKTVEDFDKWFIDYHGWGEKETIEDICNDDENLHEFYVKAFNLLNNNYSIVEISVDNGDIDRYETLASIPKEDDGSGFVMLRNDN